METGLLAKISALLATIQRVQMEALEKWHRQISVRLGAYAFPEGLFGVLPASNGVSRLTRICGPHWARWLIMANKKAAADMAYTMGLVHQVFPDETFEDEVMDFCRHLARQNPEQMGAAKVAIEMCGEVGRETGRHVERLANSALMLNPDYLAGMLEYLKGEVRSPQPSPSTGCRARARRAARRPRP